MAYFDTDFYSRQKLLVIPQDPTTFEKLQSIDKKTRYDVGAKFGIVCDADWKMNTVANCTLESIIESLAFEYHGGSAYISAINFYEVFYAKTTLRRTEKADKEGNINIVFAPGERAVRLIGATERPSIGDPITPEDFFSFPNDAEKNEYYEKIDRRARYSASKKYQFIIPDNLKFGAFAILDTFIMNLYEYMLYELGQDQDTVLTSVNFNDNIEFHAIRKPEGVVFTMRPGMNAKLIIKSDDVTEDEKDD